MPRLSSRSSLFRGLWLVGLTGLAHSGCADALPELTLQQRIARIESATERPARGARSASTAPRSAADAPATGRAASPMTPSAPPSDPSQGRVVRTKSGLEILSPVYHVDRIYRSMKGPWSSQVVKFLDKPLPELVWVTGCRVEMVSEDARTRVADQFMCHANLDIDTQRHRQLFEAENLLDGRVFTLSQGQLAVAFPPGFGLPFRSDESIDLVTQVLNLNVQSPSMKVRHKVAIDFVRDGDLKTPLRPLFESGVYGMKALDGKMVCFDQLLAENAGALCLPGAKANDWDHEKDRYGRRFTGHWVVKPGREVNRTRVTTRLNLPYDTTAHYIAVHLHPFAESVAVRDMTADKVLFQSKATPLCEGIGLERVEYFSSVEGLAFAKDHEYELVSVYNNTTKEDQDSMAVLYIYFLDKEFKRPELVPSVGSIDPGMGRAPGSAVGGVGLGRTVERG